MRGAGARESASCSGKGAIASGAFGRARLLVAACGGDELRTRTLENVGQFSWTASDGGQVTFSLLVSASEHCLSSCEGTTTSCRATLTGTHIELSSRVELRELPGVVVCPAGCLGSVASCELQVPAAGEYELAFAGRADSAALPLDGSVTLFGDHECEPNYPLLPNPFPLPARSMERIPEFRGGFQ